MPGGKGNIKHEDGKDFEKGNKAAEVWTEEKALLFADELIEWLLAEDMNIFFDEFIYLQTHPNYPQLNADTPSYLAKKFTAFAERYHRAKKIEATRLSKCGATEKTNPSMTKFLLSANHGLSERSVVDSTIKAIPPTLEPIKFNETDNSSGKDTKS